MKNPNPFSVKERAKSFIPAFNGVRLLFKSEHNAWVHLFFTITSIAIGIVVQLNNMEWLFITLSVSLVFLTELFNTAIEKLSDKVEPNYNPIIGAVKDYASAAVLIASIFAVVVGAVVFGPKLFVLIYGL